MKQGISFSEIVAESTITAERTKETDTHNISTQQNQNTLIKQIKTTIETTVQNETERLFEQIEVNSNKITVIAEALDIQFQMDRDPNILKTEKTPNTKHFRN